MFPTVLGFDEGTTIFKVTESPYEQRGQRRTLYAADRLSFSRVECKGSASHAETLTIFTLTDLGTSDQ